MSRSASLGAMLLVCAALGACDLYTSDEEPSSVFHDPSVQECLSDTIEICYSQNLSPDACAALIEANCLGGMPQPPGDPMDCVTQVHADCVAAGIDEMTCWVIAHDQCNAQPPGCDPATGENCCDPATGQNCCDPMTGMCPPPPCDPPPPPPCDPMTGVCCDAAGVCCDPNGVCCEPWGMCWPPPGCDPMTDPNCPPQCDPMTDPGCCDPATGNCPPPPPCDPMTNPNGCPQPPPGCDPMTDPNCVPPDEPPPPEPCPNDPMCNGMP